MDTLSSSSSSPMSHLATSPNYNKHKHKQQQHNHQRPNKHHRRHIIIGCCEPASGRRLLLKKQPSVLLITTILLIQLIALLNTIVTRVQVAECYNLDTEKALSKHGPKGSYFGYSIAQHATTAATTFDNSQQSNNSSASFRPCLLVGAPRADSIRSPLLTGVTRPGAIYKCDFSLAQSCQLLDVEPPLNSNLDEPLPAAAAAPGSPLDGSNEISIGANTPGSGSSSSRQPQRRQAATAAAAPPTGQLLASNMEIISDRSNQWLGVSVKSQGLNGHAVACAHRRVLRGAGVRWGQGICFSLTKNLSAHRMWQPCANRPVNRGHEEYGFCQAGTSADASSESGDLLIGSPGTYTWRGTVFTNSIGFTAKDDRTWYMAPVHDDEAKVDKYSYLGMSVLDGKFFPQEGSGGGSANKAPPLIHQVSGAPRSKETGQVLFMSKPARGSSSSSSESSSSSNRLRVEFVLDGEQMASQFGYQLAKLDFNGDGRLDLAVAAPFYFNKSRNEGGAVYLYANTGKPPLQPAGKLTGKPESRFGLALANCGDLNRDKYEDLAVGAPYDPFGGSVYIYLGSAGGLRGQPAQIIRASALGNQLQTFGYSLAGGLDMDQNGYPDLAVGSYADDSVYILRARPIVEITTRIEGNLSRIDPNKTSCDGEKNQLPCFKFNTCFELDPSKIGSDFADSMRLKYRIEAETFASNGAGGPAGAKYSRVKFQESEQSEAPHIVERTILLEDYYRGMKLKRCNAQRVYIKDRTDIQTPINFELTYELVPPGGGGGAPSSKPPQSSFSSSRYSSSGTPADSSQQQQLAAPFPILKQEEARRVFSAKFLKDCGANDVCESHLDVDGSLALPRETLGVNEPAGYLSDKSINVTIRVSNNAEPAYEARLFVAHPAGLAYSGFKASKQVSIVECAPVDRTLVRCELGNPMVKGTSKLVMIFATQNQAGTFDFNLMVNTTSQNQRDARTSFDLSGTIRKKVELQVPSKMPPIYPETPQQEPPAWLILASILLGILLFAALFYCLYVNGFFERSRANYRQAATEDSYSH